MSGHLTATQQLRLISAATAAASTSTLLIMTNQFKMNQSPTMPGLIPCWVILRSRFERTNDLRDNLWVKRLAGELKLPMPQLLIGSRLEGRVVADRGSEELQLIEGRGLVSGSPDMFDPSE